ncbi:MAG: M23 family metallopeptidase [Alphaproteobacteria bacterium]|nr:M23 family metallopeptidase [Alphaproteobacteria bacterium]
MADVFRRRWPASRANPGHLRQPIVAALLLLLLAPAARAEDIRLGLPIACKPGRDCWVVNYVDLDPGPGRRDYRCGAMSYDGHSGTDIAIPDLKAMAAGVPVLAAATGVVRAVRNDMDDVNMRDVSDEAIANRNCGNAVVLTHPGGWETMYCHMRRGSVRVRPKETVAAGQPIGLVGLSGKTEFPHVHLTVRHNGKIVDPFVGTGGRDSCALGRSPLWDPAALAALPYLPGAIHIAGIAGDRPDIKAARAGDLAAKTLPADAPALVLWTEIYNVVTGDTLRMRLLDPSGKPLTEAEQRIEKDQARVFRSTGKRRPGERWPAGTYVGEIAYLRDGKPVGAPVRTDVTVR